MKNLFFLALFLVCSVASAQEINWMTMNEALAAQKKQPKKIFMDVYTVWCGPCILLEKRTLKNKDVVTYINKHYYAVKFNAEGQEEVTYNNFKYTNPNYKEGRKGRNSQHLLAHALKIQGYPSLVFFDETSKVIAPVAGYKTPKQLELYLKMIHNNDYKKLTTSDAFKAYEQSFVSTFAN